MPFFNKALLNTASNKFLLKLDSDLDSILIVNDVRNNDIEFPTEITVESTDSIEMYYGATSDTHLENWRVVGGSFTEASSNSIQAKWDNKSVLFAMYANEIDDSE